MLRVIILPAAERDIVDLGQALLERAGRIIADAMVVAVGDPFDGQWRLLEAVILLRAVEAVRLVIHAGPAIAVESHGAVAMVRVERALWSVDWNLRVVDAQTIALRVGIREESAL